MKIGVGAVGGSIGGSNKGAVFFKICTDPWDELQSMLLGQGLCCADASFHLHRVEHTGVGATLPLGGRFAPLQHPQHPQQRQNSCPPHSKPTNTRHSNNRVITQLLNDCSWSGKKTIMLTNMSSFHVLADGLSCIQSNMCHLKVTPQSHSEHK